LRARAAMEGLPDWRKSCASPIGGGGLKLQSVIMAAYEAIVRGMGGVNGLEGHAEVVAFHCCTRRAAESICRVGMMALSLDLMTRN
jgi:hypothetical protein